MSLRAAVSFSTQLLQRLQARERERFAASHRGSRTLGERAHKHLFDGVPMHWMADWPTPFPLFIKEARGVDVTDVDGNYYVDFCLGDTGAMFGHSPAPLAQAIAAQSANGLTLMLPTEDAVLVAEELARRFGLPYWQVTTTATDANRSVIRWARALTGRKVILVFNGCYHGTVDDAMVRLRQGRTVARGGLIGQAYDLSQYSRVVEFNDVPALATALAKNDVAAALAEPVMTNCGMVLPDPGFHDALRTLTRKHDTLLIIDETHTISTGPGGYTRMHGLQPDFFVLGKPIAGGIPCAVYGFTAEMASSMQAVRPHPRPSPAGRGARDAHGHSGMGTTLSANALAMHAMHVNLQTVMTEAAYTHTIPLAEHLARELRAVFAAARVPWCITQIGARCEFQFCPTPPRNGSQAETAMNPALQEVVHLYLLNRGIVITPFHNMMLIAPTTTITQIEKLVTLLRDCVYELMTDS